MQEFIVPSSKSISNRLLIIKYLSKSEEKLHNLSLSDDTLMMQEFINRLYIYDKNKNQVINNEFYCDNAGTVTRFIIALLAFKQGIWRVDGSERMRQRPMEPLLRVLNDMGVKIVYTKEYPNALPLTIIGRDRDLDELSISIDSSLSSQFASAILLVAPYITKGLKINLSKNIASDSYIKMTISIMQSFGAVVKREDNRIKISPCPYKFKETTIESDWSSACFAYEKLCIMKEGKIFIRNFSSYTIQPDSIAKDFYKKLGIITEIKNDTLYISYDHSFKSPQQIEFDVKNSPDIFPSLLLSSLFLDIEEVRFRGITSLYHKESDRVKAMYEGIEAIGGNIQKTDKEIILRGFRTKNKLFGDDILINTYNDHRIAMAFGILSLKYPNIQIDNRDCVKKSFPNFWKSLTT